MRACGLCSVAYSDVSVGEAVKKIAGLITEPLFALAYTPDFCGFVELRGEAFYSLDGKNPVKNIFELRCFCKAFELRWAREGNTEKGRAILSYDSESGLSLPDAECEKYEKYEKCKYEKCEEGDIWALDGRYLLWGRGAKRGEAVRLFEHRVGELPVPADAKEGERVFLTFIEYFKPDEYGNMAFLAERLTGFAVGPETEE